MFSEVKKLDKIVVLLFVLVNVTAVIFAQGVKQKPNIILIMADDLGWGELGSYGNTFNETPNLDLLASQGTKFTNAYAAAPLCSPTRASIHTGQYPARVGITDYLPQSHKTDKYLNPEEHYTLNEALNDAGYYTTMIGKWHLAPDYENLKGDPESHGFNEVIGFETKFIGPGDYFYPYEYVETLNKNGEPGEFLTDQLAQEACHVIERNSDRPFFINLNFYSVHTHLDAPRELVEKYKAKYDAKYGAGRADQLFERNNLYAGYPDNPYLAAMIERMDTAVGEIMRKLEEKDLADNTMLIFFSDNGGVSGIANNGNLRSGKTWLYEGGVRDNLIVRYPRHVESVPVSHEPVSSIDFYPTFTELAGIQSVPQKLDGTSILPALKGDEFDREALYWYYPAETIQDDNRKGYSVRRGDFKYYYFYPFDREELYDLSIDPGEKNDISKRRPKITADLRETARNWMADVKAPVSLKLTEDETKKNLLTGTLTWEIPTPDEGIDGYEIHFLDENANPIGNPVQKVQAGTHQTKILNVQVPENAKYIGAFTYIANVMSPVPAKFKIK